MTHLKLTYNISEWSELNLNYWGIPKCGNTSIKKVLLDLSHRQIDPGSSKYWSWIHSEKHIQYITPSYAFTNGRVNFTVIRNPIDRFKSMLKDFDRRPRQFSQGEKWRPGNSS